MKKVKEGRQKMAITNLKHGEQEEEEIVQEAEVQQTSVY